MKQIICALCLSLAFVSTAIAQQAYASPTLSYFKAEGSVFYEVKDCVPNTDAAFYSQKGGGKLLKMVRADANGSFVVQEERAFRPAFVLNRRNPYTKEGGSGKVGYAGASEFVINGIEITGNKRNNIAWRAATEEPIVFEIVKTTDGVHYNSLAVINAIHSKEEIPYTYTDEANTLSASYKVLVINKKTGLRYSSRPLSIAIPGTVNIYPTITSSIVTVSLHQHDVNAAYKIINLQGQTVQSGLLSEEINPIFIGHFTAGMYGFIIQTGSKIITERIIKE